jgi:hypothetical protein
MGNLYVGLLHFPMRDRRGDIVATAMTSIDVHDIARSARTYGVARYFVVTPLPSQKRIGWRIRGFWTEGERAMEASRRGDALEIVTMAEDLEESIAWIRDAEGMEPLVVATSARIHEGRSVSYQHLRREIAKGEKPILIIFGTGWGMVDELIEACDMLLPPIMPASDFNHLSVRAAAAIILDRVAGDRIGGENGQHH